MSISLKCNVSGCKSLKIFIRDYDKFISIEGHSLYLNKGKNCGRERHSYRFYTLENEQPTY